MPEPELPTITPWLLKGFLAYIRRYVRKHFHAVRRLKEAEPDVPNGVPLIVVLNHASWWDPLACFFLHDKFEAFSSRRHFAPIDAEMLERYAVFKRLGFFGVEPDTPRGARAFLKTGRAVLGGGDAGQHGLWVTAQGRFADVRQRPVELRPGVAHLIERLRRDGREDTVVLPLAIEYPFWDQRTPELLLAFGEALPASSLPAGTDATHAVITDALTRTMDRLADAAVSREPERFVSLTAGRTGVGGVYDAARRVKAALTGRRFDASHGRNGSA